MWCRASALTRRRVIHRTKGVTHDAQELCSVRVVTATYSVPSGWLSRTASRSPLLLVNAFAFAKSSTPPPDQWTHFAKLRPVPWKLVVVFVVIALVCVWGTVATVTHPDNSPQEALVAAVLFGAGALFFGWATIASLVSARKRSGWPHLHGVGIGESGVAFRLTGGDADVPWDAITAIEATVTNEDNPRKAKIPVLRIEYAGSRVDLNTAILGSSPLVTYAALTYYWRTPGSRGELGTTVAQKRMNAWLATS
jgi:hypothetical protein